MYKYIYIYITRIDLTCKWDVFSPIWLVNFWQKKSMGISAASERSAEVCAKNMTKVRWIADRQHGAAGD